MAVIIVFKLLSLIMNICWRQYDVNRNGTAIALILCRSGARRQTQYPGDTQDAI